MTALRYSSSCSDAPSIRVEPNSHCTCRDETNRSSVIDGVYVDELDYIWVCLHFDFTCVAVFYNIFIRVILCQQRRLQTA